MPFIDQGILKKNSINKKLKSEKLNTSKIKN